MSITNLQEIRVAVRALEQTAREALTILQGIHQTPNEGVILLHVHTGLA